MAERLKNTLAFSNLAAGASIDLVHGLCTSRPRPLAADVIFVPSPDLAIDASTNVSITLRNAGATPLSGNVLVEAWHTIERAFSDVADEDLPVKPYVIVSAEANNQPPQPAFQSPSVEKIVYARLSGNDTTGNGTLAKPYRTFQRAIRDTPNFIPPGVIWTVDITGIGTEALPPDYELPAVLAPRAIYLSVEAGGPIPLPFPIGSSFNIRAIPQPASNIPLADTTIAPGQIVGVTQSPISNLVTIEVTNHPSYAADALKGKFLTVAGSGFSSCVIHASDATHLYVTQDFDAFTGGTLSISEPSATLETTAVVGSFGISSFNAFQIGWQGIKLTKTGPGIALRHQGGSFPNMALCDVDGLHTVLVASNFLTWGCVMRTEVSFDGAAFTTFNGLLIDCFIFNAGSAGNVWLSTVNERCFAMTSIPTYTQGGAGYPPCGWEFVDCLFRDGVDPKGAVWANGGGTYSLQNVEINNQAGPTTDGAVTCEGGSYMFLQTVGGIGNAGVGVRANDGAQIRCLDDGVTLTGTLGDMKAGTKPVRAWGTAIATPPGNFYFDAPQKNELDLVSPPVGDETTGAGTGGTSLSRIFARPF